MFDNNMTVLSLLSEEDRARQAETFNNTSYFAAGNTQTANSNPQHSTAHNILQQGYPLAPLKACRLLATTGQAQSTSPSCHVQVDEEGCSENATPKSCIFTEVEQDDIPVECAPTAACEESSNYGACNTEIELAIKTKYEVDYTAQGTITQSTSGPLGATWCAELTEWECRNSGELDDARYASFEPANLTGTEIEETTRTCWLKSAPSINMSTSPSVGNHLAESGMTEKNTALYANPQWPHKLGVEGLSVKTSMLKGETMADNQTRGDRYQTDPAGPSGNAENYKFDGYIPDMTYVRPEYDVTGGYEGVNNTNSKLEFGQADVGSGHVTWFWNNKNGRYEVSRASLVMTDNDTNFKRVIQPDPDASSRSQRQVSLDTMLQFADAIGITAVDNEQALYEWKLDALQTLLDRINTSHKATAFTYAATGHQLLNLLERFQAHSGATDDLLYYMVTIMTSVQQNMADAVDVVKNFAFGADDGSGKPASSPLVVGNTDALKLEYLPRPPKAFNAKGSGGTRIYHPRFVTNPSHPATALERLGVSGATSPNGMYKAALLNQADQSNTTSPIFNRSTGALESWARIAPGVPNLETVGGKTPSKITEYIKGLSFDPQTFRPDGMGSQAPEPGNTDALFLSDATLGHDIEFTTGTGFAASTDDATNHRRYAWTSDPTISGRVAGPSGYALPTTDSSSPVANTAGYNPDP
jgi:hypothetical protein